ncbi:hypothetical protein PTSG_06416 [Salpingoeca rosetta]|uniref:Uncharacterized protein n=1 Tax=Salpingoeca rosetta (strain ATCC 50818 / BSB-021) TaxID=946362 RepID=F2UBZ0_SALR5|nr:uncharacterized protein PTSG_06416 [Salpingoeca rosetta]EGD74405.1 hypothetical protein PTSG_06416 [Salpingoeca rosetta]|eukprot:XP_004993305.1 hypothetical protein PTSG_06416 [Salpingoeca rosetta]
MSAWDFYTPGDSSDDSTEASQDVPVVYTTLPPNEVGVLARAYLQAATAAYTSLLEGTQQDANSQYHAFAEKIRTIATKNGIEVLPVWRAPQKPATRAYLHNMMEVSFTEDIKTLLQEIRSVFDIKKTVTFDEAESFLRRLDNFARKGPAEHKELGQFRQELQSSVDPCNAAKEKKKGRDVAHRTVYAQPFSAELLCPDWHLHNEWLKTINRKDKHKSFCGVFRKAETRFNDRMSVALIRACAGAAVNVKSHSSFEADPTVVVHHAVRLNSNVDCYPLLIDLKTRDSRRTQDTAKAQVLEYAAKAIKSAGPEWRQLKGYLFPFAITVCMYDVSVYACTLGEEMHGGEAFPSVLYTKLGDTDLEKLGHVIEWLVDEEHMAHYEKISAIAQGREDPSPSTPALAPGMTTTTADVSDTSSTTTTSTTTATNTSDKEEAAQSGSTPQQQAVSAKRSTKTASGSENTTAATKTDTADSSKKDKRQRAGTKGARARSAKVATRYEMCVYKGGEDTAVVAMVNGKMLKVCSGHGIFVYETFDRKLEAARKAKAAMGLSVTSEEEDAIADAAARELEADNELQAWQLLYPGEKVEVHQRSRPVLAFPHLAPTEKGTGIKGMDALTAAAEYLLVLSKNGLCHMDIRSHNILPNGCIVDFGLMCEPDEQLPESYFTRLRERPRRVLHHHDPETITLDVVLDWESLLFAYVFSPGTVSKAMLRLLEGKAILLQWLADKRAELLDNDNDKETAELLHKIMQHVARVYF